MQEHESDIEDWRKDITPKTATLKVRDGEVARVTFQNEGVKKESKDFGNSVAFLVRVDGDEEDKTFYIKSNNFEFLGQIKELGKLTGLRCEISRKGKLKSDTRYAIKKI